MSAFIILQVPRHMLVACLFAATVTVGFAVLVTDATRVNASARAASPPSRPSPVSDRAVPSRAAAAMMDNPDRLP